MLIEHRNKCCSHSICEPNTRSGCAASRAITAPSTGCARRYFSAAPLMIVVTARLQHRQEVQARFRPAGADDRKVVAADLRGDNRVAGMPRAGIISGDGQREDEARRVVLLFERLQIHGEQAHHLPLGGRNKNSSRSRRCDDQHRLI
jgi:hypothetical protein